MSGKKFKGRNTEMLRRREGAGASGRGKRRFEENIIIVNGLESAKKGRLSACSLPSGFEGGVRGNSAEVQHPLNQEKRPVKRMVARSLGGTMNPGQARLATGFVFVGGKGEGP